MIETRGKKTLLKQQRLHSSIASLEHLKDDEMQQGNDNKPYHHVQGTRQASIVGALATAISMFVDNPNDEDEPEDFNVGKKMMSHKN